jgi:hypothetical protein
MKSYSLQGREAMYSGGDNVSEEPVASIFRVEKFVTPK